MLLIERLLRLFHLQRTSTALAIVPPQLSGRWTRVVTEDDIILGYTFTCLCGETKKYRTNESSVDTIHRCGCSRDFNLKSSLTLVGADTKIIKREKPQRTMQTIGEAFDGNFRYEPLR